MKGFTRQETIALTNTTSSRLSYLDRAKLIRPEKYGSTKKPTVIYSWEQVLEIKAISELRQKVSLQTVRKIIEYLDQSGFDKSLRDKRLVALNEEVYWVLPDWSEIPKIIKVADSKGNDIGQFILVAVPPLSEIIHEVWELARSSHVIDFDSFKKRAKHKSA